ncbi:MAG: methyltetrahydrofolate cobalamin methyltransferase [Dehalococcoidia bacterium]|jgi:5-methyltetrahydrofolate--homocysteine methyltransferase
MLIVGERINSTRESIAKAIREQDSAFIQDEARQQVEAGADYLDVNAGAFMGEELKYLTWLVEIVQDVVDKPLCLDTSNAEALAAALKLCRVKPMLSSISAEKKRYESFLPIVKSSGCKVVALCVDDSGIPHTADTRTQVANRLIGSLVAEGVALDDIYVDVLAQAVSTDDKAGAVTFETIRRVNAAHPGVHTILGLSNVSFGLPNRRLINQNFISMCMEAGLDSAIADPKNNKLMANILAANLLLGKDRHGMSYIKAFRAGKLE